MINVKRELHLVQGGDFPYIQIPKLNQIEGFFHMFTTRNGGYSQGPYASFNLSFASGDSLESVTANKNLLSQFFGKQVIFPKQIHGNNIVILDDYSERINASLPADGLISNLKGGCIGVLTADCLPLILVAPEKKCVALVHAGWRSSFGGIAKKAVDMLKARFGANPRSILVGIGPCIRVCCYEVGAELADFVKQRFPDQNELVIPGNGTVRVFLDLVKFNLLTLFEEGVSPENTFDCNLCTYCQQDLFFSHRAQRGPTGRQAAVAMWR
ncbi:MAG: peptidoglycan editing factor PgeF [Candidatus Tectomicrobia bacterium]|uniref:Purine nucleoside phosphorylase n=1 Tax=Tectimicrobiota bacterium TaxID=2528274 RepID=A0A933GJT9_UNCTE|nr:peptidoglycan editing factor PgeF [Candidatus Tectomicrobia bacterium]